VQSQQRAAQAWKEGRFKKSIVPVKDQLGVTLLDRDEFMRPETTLQSLGALEPSFKMQGEMMPGFDGVIQQRYPEIEKIDHVHHAGNSSGIVDGAAGVLIGTKEMGEALGLKPRAKILGGASIGSEPSIMLTGPEFVTAKLMKKLGLTSKTSIFGSSTKRSPRSCCAGCRRSISTWTRSTSMAAPSRWVTRLGATGAMILGTMVDELERADKERALITLCIGAGMGTATVIERVN
jgi:acetyl-CoA C-acetyltransferase